MTAVEPALQVEGNATRECGQAPRPLELHPTAYQHHGSTDAPLPECAVDTIWPPRTRDRSSVMRAYTDVLNWTLFNGMAAVCAAEAEVLVESNPATPLTTTCSAFDAVTIPFATGMDLLLWLDRSSLRVPSVVDERTVTLLVRGGTGHCLRGIGAVSIAEGAGDRITLPPSLGTRWDTTPWEVAEPRAIDLANARHLKPGLERAVSLFGRS